MPRPKTMTTQEAQKRYHERHGITKWDRYLPERYGITADEAEYMLEDQNYLCACCFQPLEMSDRRKRHIDHNHTTGVVRGIVCARCNSAIGYAENAELQRDIKLYLEVNCD